VIARNTAVGSAIRNFVTDILITPAIRNSCVLNPKRCFPKRTPMALFSPGLRILAPETETVKNHNEFISNFDANNPEPVTL
jgi:hypothetical protein